MASGSYPTRLTDPTSQIEPGFKTHSYKQHELTDAAAHDLLVQVLDARVLPVTKHLLALQEWRTPRHPEFREGGKTAWRFFNSITEAAKGGDIRVLPRRTQTLHGLMGAACGLTTLAV